jgi:hypothetical protein
MPTIVCGVPDVREESGTSAVFDDTCGNYIQIHGD